MNMLQKATQKVRKNKKGFTLVELLVVLVILAILAAAIIPSMMGFIDKAREESAAAECRSALLAGEVVMNEMYGLGTLTNDTVASGEDNAILKEINDVADFTGTAKVTSMTFKKDADNHFDITNATFTASNNATYSYSSTTHTWTKTN